MEHKFRIGQTVDLKPMVIRAAAPGEYSVCQLVPASDRDAENPLYRVKSAAEKHERIVPESELRLSTRSDSLVKERSAI